MACFGSAFHKVTITAKAGFGNRNHLSEMAIILDRFIQIPPVTIREGHRVKIYFTQDMLLPAFTHDTRDFVYTVASSVHGAVGFVELGVS